MSAARRPTAAEHAVLLGFHALVSGSFLVAWLSGDEDSYVMHEVAGYTLLGAVALRLLLGLVAPRGSPLGLPRPDGAAIRGWAWRLLRGEADARRQRSPLHAAMALALLAALAAATLSGVVADSWPRLDDLHGALADAALWVALAHVALVLALQGLKRIPAPALLLVPAMLAAGTALANPARQAILAGYAAEARRAEPGFTGFSAARGQTLYLGPHAGGRAETPACATCHTPDPTREGRHQRTGRGIPPMAVSADPRRFTDAAEVEKRFARDCQAVLGRACTAREKGDFVTFLEGR